LILNKDAIPTGHLALDAACTCCQGICLVDTRAAQHAARARGRQAKKNRRAPPFICYISDQPTHHPTFFSLVFSFSTFLGVSRQGEFKNTTQVFWQKVRIEKKIQNFDKNFDVSLSSTFFVLWRFRVFFSDGSSKALQKRFAKKSCQKVFTKNSTKSPKPTFSRICFITFLGVSR
jgi:hypothetical protein